MKQAPIAERVEAQIDTQELIESVWPLLQKHPAVHRSPAFGGWSLQSTNGSYEDGWTLDFCPYNGPENMGPSWRAYSPEEEKLKTIQEYILPTQITSVPFSNLLQKLEDMGLNPRRGRIIKLKAHSATVWHQDGSTRFYQARIHIPLITNSECFFETDEGKHHMPADGGLYFVHINKMHRAVNNSAQDRYHFVAHVWDQKHITRFHQYRLENNLGESIHPDQIAPGSLFRKS